MAGTGGTKETSWGEWLQDALTAKKMTRADLIEKVGVNAEGSPILTRGQISHWVNGSSRPSLKNLYRVVTALDASLDDALQAAGYRRSGSRTHHVSTDAEGTTALMSLDDPDPYVTIRVSAADAPVVMSLIAWLKAQRELAEDA